MTASTFILYDVGARSLGQAYAPASARCSAINLSSWSVCSIRLVGGCWPCCLSLVAGVFIGYKYYHSPRYLRMAKISVEELKQRMDAGEAISVVDAPVAWRSETILRAINFTMEEIEHRHHEIRGIGISCSIAPVQMKCPVPDGTAFLLKKKGIHRVRPLVGGLDAWRERKFPVARRPNAGLRV